MNKTNIIGIAVAIILLTGIVWMARPDDSSTNGAATPSSNSKGTLNAEETNYDFGSISMAAGNVIHSFKIKNTGTDPVIIEKMYTSCMCTSATLIKNGAEFGPYGMVGHGFIPKINESLDAGEEATVEVVFDPAAHGPAGVGRIQRVVTVENDAGGPVKLQFTAVVTP